MSPREAGGSLEKGTWGWVGGGVVLRSGLQCCVSRNSEASLLLGVIGLLEMLPTDQTLQKLLSTSECKVSSLH